MSIRIIITAAIATVLLSQVAVAGNGVVVQSGNVNFANYIQHGPKPTPYVPGTLTQRSPCPVCSFKVPALVRR
jgi:hypothetical protein